MIASRRAFLRGRFHSTVDEIRPPWAVSTPEFETCCTRCGDCIEACPQKILKTGDGGFPTVDFSAGECTFCAECVSACKPRALHREPDRRPWSLKAMIGNGCLAPQGVECRVCGEICPESAIRFRPRPGGVAKPWFEADRCTGCGACFAPCPVRAIRLENWP